MKYAIIVLLIIFNSFCSSAQKKVVRAESKEKKEKVTAYHEPIPAQKHHLFADVGYTPGFSVTYNYKIAKHLGAGIGVQGYKFYRAYEDFRQFTPGVFGDIRLYIRPEKNNQFILFLDLGIDIYKQDKRYFHFYNLNNRYQRDSTVIYNIPHNNGFYTGLGFGYFRRMTKSGGGPYVSLKAVSNWFTLRGYSIVSEDNDIVLSSAGGAMALSLGFKF